MKRSGRTVTAVRSLMEPGNPVPAEVRVGSWQDLAGQQTYDLILNRAGSEVAGAPLRKGGTAAQPPQPGKPPGRWLRAAAPLAAALAVAGVVGGLVLVAHLSPTPGRHASGALAAADKGMPSLYVTLSFQGEPSRVVAEVHAARAGQVLSKVNVGPVVAAPWITADRSGRTYVINAGARNGGAALYKLRVSGDGHSAKVTKLPINLPSPASHQVVVDGLALSPDGSKLAVALQDVRGKGVGNLTGTMRVYRLAGGAPQAWAAPGDPGLPFSPVWTGADQLTFVWQDHLRGTEWFYDGRSQIRVLDTAARGRNLLSSRVLVTGGGRLGFIQSALAGPGDSPIMAATFRVSPAGGTSGTASLQLAELSANGAVRKVFAKPTFHYFGQVQEGRVVARCQVVGIDATGQHTLANCPSFGRIDHGKFTPLPHGSGDFGGAW
jgi:hypothetical protein